MKELGRVTFSPDTTREGEREEAPAEGSSPKENWKFFSRLMPVETVMTVSAKHGLKESPAVRAAGRAGGQAAGAG